MKKKLLVMLLGLAMIIALAACGGSGDSAPADSGSDDAQPAAALDEIVTDAEAKTDRKSVV